MTAGPCLVGIDVSKTTLDVAILPGTSVLHLANSPAGWDHLIARLVGVPSPCIVLEATGSYHVGVTLALAAAGIPASVINPQRIHAFRRSEGIRTKTDRRDALLLASFAQQKHPASTPVLAENVRNLKELVGCHDDLVKMITMETNRKQVSTAISHGFHQAVIDDVKRHKRLVDLAITELIAADPDLTAQDRLLQSVPGIGWYISAAIIGGFSELGTYSRKAAAAVAGLAPHPCDSGQASGARRISGGRADIRRVLYQMANTAVVWNPVVRQHYQQLIQRRPRKVALIACARRMLGILRIMLRNHITWQETRVATTFAPRNVS